MSRTPPTDRASADPLAIYLAAVLARVTGLRAAWLWWEVGRGLAARKRGWD